MNFVMLLHSAASSRASPVVILRQLLSPKPSASANVICLEPHHDGVPEAAAAVLVPPLAVLAPLPVVAAAAADVEPPPAPPLLLLVEELEPHAATTTTIPRASRLDARAFALHCINVSTLSIGSLV